MRGRSKYAATLESRREGVRVQLRQSEEIVPEPACQVDIDPSGEGLGGNRRVDEPCMAATCATFAWSLAC